MYKDIIKDLPRRRFVFWGLLLITAVVCEIALTISIPWWKEYFFDVLHSKDIGLFHTALALFTVLMVGLGIAQGLKTWLGQRVSFILREVKTHALFSKWNKGTKNEANYGQALTEAIQNSTELYIEIFVETLISGSIVVALVISNLGSPIILAASLVYTVVVSIVAAFFNTPLIEADMSLQKASGEFRTNLTKIANGIDDDSHDAKWKLIVFTYYNYIKTTMYFTLFTRVKGAAGTLVPYLLLAPSFFAGSITLGAFMAGVSVFELIVLNSTIVLLLYPKLTKARASQKLIKDFYRDLTEKD